MRTIFKRKNIRVYEDAKHKRQYVYRGGQRIVETVTTVDYVLKINGSIWDRTPVNYLRPPELHGNPEAYAKDRIERAIRVNESSIEQKKNAITYAEGRLEKLKTIMQEDFAV